MEENNQTAKLSKCVGFLIDTADFEAEIAALSEIDSASKTVLQVGNMDDFDSYIADIRSKQKNAGIDKVIEKINNQYSEWKENKE